MIDITHDMLEIPPSLHDWYINRGWFSDYWKEIPLDWQQWSDKDLSKYSITNEIVLWKASH